MKLTYMAAALMALVCFATNAFAADTTWSPGSLYVSLEPYILSIFGAVFSILMTWALTIFQKRTGIAVSDSARADLQQSAMNAAGRIMASQEATFANIKLDVKSPLIAAELPKVQVSAQDAITRLGVTPDRVSALILGKVGQLQVSAQATAPVVVVPTDATKGQS